MDLKLLQLGNEAEWALVDRQIRGTLAATFYRLGLRHDEQSEIVNQTIVALLKDDSKLLNRAQPTKVSAFIRRIAFNKAQHYVRGRRRREKRVLSMGGAAELDAFHVM